VICHTDLKAAKEAEIKAGQEQIDKKTQELASTDEQVAQDKQDLEDTGSELEIYLRWSREFNSTVDL
jgi:hypothetical protein